MADDSTCSFRAVDLRLGVRESLWLAGFCCLFRQLTQSRSSVSVHWCGSLSLCVCVSFWSRCICVALPGFRVSQHTHVHSPSPRSISQSIKCLLSVSLFTARQQQTVCILTVRVYSRGNHTQPSHSPSFGEAFPTAISPRRPALSLLRALQQCPSPALAHVPLWSWSCHFPCFPAPCTSCLVLVLLLLLLLCCHFLHVRLYQGQVPKCRARIDRL